MAAAKNRGVDLNCGNEVLAEASNVYNLVTAFERVL